MRPVHPTYPTASKSRRSEAVQLPSGGSLYQMALGGMACKRSGSNNRRLLPELSRSAQPTLESGYPKKTRVRPPCGVRAGTRAGRRRSRRQPHTRVPCAALSSTGIEAPGEERHAVECPTIAARVPVPGHGGRDVGRLESRTRTGGLFPFRVFYSPPSRRRNVHRTWPGKGNDKPPE